MMIMIMMMMMMATMTTMMMHVTSHQHQVLTSLLDCTKPWTTGTWHFIYCRLHTAGFCSSHIINTTRHVYSPKSFSLILLCPGTDCACTLIDSWHIISQLCTTVSCVAYAHNCIMCCICSQLYHVLHMLTTVSCVAYAHNCIMCCICSTGRL